MTWIDRLSRQQTPQETVALAVKKLRKTPALLTPELLQAAYDRYVDPESKHAKSFNDQLKEEHTWIGFDYIRTHESTGQEKVWVMKQVFDHMKFVEEVRKLAPQATVEDIGTFRLSRSSHIEQKDNMYQSLRLECGISLFPLFQELIDPDRPHSGGDEEREQLSRKMIFEIAKKTFPQLGTDPVTPLGLEWVSIVEDPKTAQKIRDRFGKENVEPIKYTPETAESFIGYLADAVRVARRGKERFTHPWFTTMVAIGTTRNGENNLVFTVRYEIDPPTYTQRDVVYEERFVFDPTDQEMNDQVEQKKLSEAEAATLARFALYVTIDNRLAHLDARLREETSMAPASPAWGDSATRNYGLIYAYMPAGENQMGPDMFRELLDTARITGIQPFPFGEESVHLTFHQE